MYEYTTSAYYVQERFSPCVGQTGGRKLCVPRIINPASVARVVLSCSVLARGRFPFAHSVNRILLFLVTPCMSLETARGSNKKSAA